MRELYGPGQNEYVEFMAATVYYGAGDLDLAYSIFDKQFKKYKGRSFQGEDPKYLIFYKARALGK